ncbi:hypothetical protein BJF83_10390 [Nocardiopsis sp. CNR-923]|uniref:hypothetical protein n=1 Tax=Nocardiopsis sp. CNR-923 TaxID=1904965 RepID=UPI000964926C|nr:hypothetical protein [Nocardiopsis sp. CNR-923]OLT29763.1 hypothetical protein BJF83_10390 [Nocardiopsis sp. CNR-923]
MGFLLPHVVLQISFTRLNAAHSVLPFGADTAVAYGIIATDLLIVVSVTGVMRGRFAGTSRSWTWRAIHLTVYLCWPMAVVHGLTAGRAPSSWIVIGYLLCLLAVCAALVLRLVVTTRPEIAERAGDRAASELLTPPAPDPKPAARPSPHPERHP